MQLGTLNIHPRINLNPHPCHTRILRQHDIRIYTILQICLMLEHRRILDVLDAFRRVFVALPKYY